MGGVPSTYAGTTDVLTLLVLLSEFAMLRAPLLRSQIRLYAFQSLVVTVLAIVVAASRHVPELYALAAVTFVLKVVLVPGLVLRLMRKADTDLAGSSVLGVASMILIAILVSVFGFVTITTLHLHSDVLPTPTLAISVAIVDRKSVV